MKWVRPRYNHDFARTEFLTSYSMFGHLYMTCPLQPQEESEDDEKSRCHDLCAWITLEPDPEDSEKGFLFCKNVKIANYYDDRKHEDEEKNEEEV